MIAGIFSILSEIIQGTSVIYFSHEQDFPISSFTRLSVYNPFSLLECDFALNGNVESSCKDYLHLLLQGFWTSQGCSTRRGLLVQEGYRTVKMQLALFPA